MKTILLSVILCAAGLLGTAQEFVFNYNMKELDEVQQSTDIKDHFLGEDIAKKMQLLKESYTYKEVNEISQTEFTVVEKPSIYRSVNKMSKYLQKDVKKGRISKEKAYTQLDNVLNIAINIRYQDTEKLEKELWKIKEPENLKALFSDQIVLSM